MYTFNMHMRNWNKFMKLELGESLPPGAFEEGAAPLSISPRSCSPKPMDSGAP